jgi:hypothetical protein
MKECIVKNCTSTSLVYSGIDAMILGVPTERVCYEHANIYKQVDIVVEEYNDALTSI